MKQRLAMWTALTLLFTTLVPGFAALAEETEIVSEPITVEAETYYVEPEPVEYIQPEPAAATPVEVVPVEVTPVEVSPVAEPQQSEPVAVPAVEVEPIAVEYTEEQTVVVPVAVEAGSVEEVSEAVPVEVAPVEVPEAPAQAAETVVASIGVGGSYRGQVAGETVVIRLSVNADGFYHIHTDGLALRVMVVGEGNGSVTTLSPNSSVNIESDIRLSAGSYLLKVTALSSGIAGSFGISVTEVEEVVEADVAVQVTETAEEAGETEATEEAAAEQPSRPQFTLHVDESYSGSVAEGNEPDICFVLNQTGELRVRTEGSAVQLRITSESTGREVTVAPENGAELDRVIKLKADSYIIRIQPIGASAGAFTLNVSKAAAEETETAEENTEAEAEIAIEIKPATEDEVGETETVETPDETEAPATAEDTEDETDTEAETEIETEVEIELGAETEDETETEEETKPTIKLGDNLKASDETEETEDKPADETGETEAAEDETKSDEAEETEDKADDINQEETAEDAEAEDKEDADAEDAETKDDEEAEETEETKDADKDDAEATDEETKDAEDAEETEDGEDEAETEQAAEREHIDLAVNVICEYEAPYYYEDELTLVAAQAVTWQMSLDGVEWQTIGEGEQLPIVLDEKNANAFWRAVLDTETAEGESQALNFHAVAYTPDWIQISMEGNAATHVYGDVIHFHAEYFTLSTGARVIWQGSRDGNTWFDLGEEGSDLTLIVNENTDGLQVRAKLVTDDTLDVAE